MSVNASLTLKSSSDRCFGDKPQPQSASSAYKRTYPSASGSAATCRWLHAAHLVLFVLLVRSAVGQLLLLVFTWFELSDIPRHPESSFTWCRRTGGFT